MKIYVASSWRNILQPDVVRVLRNEGYDVYDFRERGFAWSDIDPHWKLWSPERFRKMLLTNPTVQAGFRRDMDALQACDTCVLVEPCGRSAHLEFGWACGAGKHSVILLCSSAVSKPDLMCAMADVLCTSIWDLNQVLREIAKMVR